MLHDLSQEVGRSFGRHGARDDQALKIARGVQDVVELLLMLRRNRCAGVQDAILVLAIIDVGVDARDTVGQTGRHRQPRFMTSSTINLPVKPAKKPSATVSTPIFLKAKDTSMPCR